MDNTVDNQVVLEEDGKVIIAPTRDRRLADGWDRMLLDPARSGARDIVESADQIGAARIVYVSCHPGTLARDAGILVNEKGYRLEAAGIIDMFPHTGHVESLAVFQKS